MILAYRRASKWDAVATAAANFFRPQYLRALARAGRQWEFAAAQSAIRQVSLASLADLPLDIGLTLFPYRFGDTPVADLVALCALVRRHRPHMVFEFGTLTGLATIHLLANAAQDAQVFTLELSCEERRQAAGLDWERNIDQKIIGIHFRDTPQAGQITQILCDSLRFDPAPYRQQMDFVWVDACHEYANVKNDTEKAFEMLAPGGVVAWHDFSRTCPGVGEYLKTLVGKHDIRWIAGTEVAFCQME